MTACQAVVPALAGHTSGKGLSRKLGVAQIAAHSRSMPDRVVRFRVRREGRGRSWSVAVDRACRLAGF